VGSLPAKVGAHVVLIDPDDPSRVYAAGDSGLYRSDDAGQTWEPASQGLPDGGVAALALDPRQPRRLYAAAATGALYLTEDGASSWRALPGAVRGAGS
jgi:photosystem II stability/assembly factor-like uncharacterized protein